MRKKKDKQNFKRIAAAVIAILIALVMLLGLLQPLFASTLPAAQQAPAITIDGRVGFNRMHKMFGYTPFNIRLTNEGGDFEGTLRIMVDVSTDRRERNFVSYAGEVFVESGTTKEVEMVIPLTSSRRTYRVVLTDTNGQIAASRMLFASAVESQLVMAGVLTDNRQAAARLRWLSVDTLSWRPDASILNERLVLLDETVMPSSAKALDSFDLLIIDDFDISHLSDAQVGAIYEWTKDGGTLVLGERGELEFVHSLDRFEEVYAERMRRTASYAELPLPDAGELTHVMPLGAGTVIVHDFLLMSEEFMAQEYAIDFLSSVYRAAINISSGAGTMNNQILQLTTNLPLFSYTSLIVVFVIVGVYALVIGVVLYMVLKKRDRRELAIIVIPVTALIVASVVTIVGFGSGYQEPIVSAVTRLEFEGGSSTAAATTATGVYWPTSDDIIVNVANGAPIVFELSPQSGIMPLAISDNMPSRVTERNEAELMGFGTDERSQIKFFGRPSWSGGHFSQTLEVELEGSLHGEFTFEGNALVGTIRNDTGFDIFDLIVGVGTTFNRHDFLAHGDTLEIREVIGNQALNFSWWSIVESAFPFHGLGHSLSPEQGRDLHFRRDILMNMLSSGAGLARIPTANSAVVSAVSPPVEISLPEARRIAPDSLTEENNEVNPIARTLTHHEFGTPISIHVMGYSHFDATGMDITVNGATPTAIYTNFLITSFPMTLEGSTDFDLPMGLIGPTAIISDVSLDFDTFSNNFSTSDAGFAEFIYDFGTARIDELAVEFDSFGIEAVIFNHQTGEWHRLDAIRGDEGHYAYIYNGEMRVRVDFSAFSWIGPPRVHIKGGN